MAEYREIKSAESERLDAESRERFRQDKKRGKEAPKPRKQPRQKKSITSSSDGSAGWHRDPTATSKLTAAKLMDAVADLVYLAASFEAGRGTMSLYHQEFLARFVDAIHKHGDELPLAKEKGGTVIRPGDLAGLRQHTALSEVLRDYQKGRCAASDAIAQLEELLLPTHAQRIRPAWNRMKAKARGARKGKDWVTIVGGPVDAATKFLHELNQVGSEKAVDDPWLHSRMKRALDLSAAKGTEGSIIEEATRVMTVQIPS